MTTIPAIANIGVATAYADWSEVGGSVAQLSLNLVALFLGGIARLFVQRRVYFIRLGRHRRRLAKEAEALPIGERRRRAALRLGEEKAGSTRGGRR